MKKVVSLIVSIFVFSIIVSNVSFASEIPAGYNKYGDLAEEYYCDDLELLAMLVYAEAGDQDLYGKELVVDVVLNRIDDPEFPDTISDVIYQKNQFSTAKHLGTVNDDCYTAVKNEIEERNDYDIEFFRMWRYGCGTPAYKYGDHYFSTNK